MKRLIFLAALPLLLACDRKSEIVGHWYNIASRSHTARFEADGTYSGFDPFTRTITKGRWSLVNETTLRIEFQGRSGPVIEEIQFKISNDIMSTEKKNGVLGIWKRAKLEQRE